MAKRQYLNNRDFLDAIIKYKAALREAEQSGKPKPQIPRYCGEAVVLICTRMGRRPNFSGYSYNEDMVNDAILNCIAVFDNFNPEKSQNPFGFFSRIGWRAMLRRISDEAKENYCKHKNASNMFEHGLHYEGHPDWTDSRAIAASDRVKNNGQASSGAGSVVGASQDVINRFEAFIASKKRPSKPSGDLTSQSPGISTPAIAETLF